MRHLTVEKLPLEIKTRKIFNKKIKIPWANRLPLSEALRRATYLKEPIFPIRDECLEPEYEHEWARVQRMRKENHPLIKGGKQS